MLLTWRTRWGANVAGTRTRLHVRLPVGGRLGLGRRAPCGVHIGSEQMMVQRSRILSGASRRRSDEHPNVRILCGGHSLPFMFVNIHVNIRQVTGRGETRCCETAVTTNSITNPLLTVAPYVSECEV